MPGNDSGARTMASRTAAAAADTCCWRCGTPFILTCTPIDEHKLETCRHNAIPSATEKHWKALLSRTCSGVARIVNDRDSTVPSFHSVRNTLEKHRTRGTKHGRASCGTVDKMEVFDSCDSLLAACSTRAGRRSCIPSELLPPYTVRCTHGP